MKKLTLEQMETTEGGKFWGSVYSESGCTNGFKTCYRTYYVFWLEWTVEQQPITACNIDCENVF